jgi:hypothetical protein
MWGVGASPLETAVEHEQAEKNKSLVLSLAFYIWACVHISMLGMYIHVYIWNIIFKFDSESALQQRQTDRTLAKESRNEFPVQRK